MLTPNRDLRRVKVNTTPSGSLGVTDGNQIFISLHGVPNDGVIKNLRFYSGSIPVDVDQKITIKVLTDPARYRAAEAATTGSGEPYVVMADADVTSSSGPNTYWLKDFTYSYDMPYRDDLKSNCLHVMLEAASTLDAVASFTVQAEVEGLPNLALTQDTNHFGGQRNLQVLRWSSGNLWKDLTPDALNWNQNSNAALSLFTAATDWVYFGSPDVFSGLLFNLKVANTQVAATLDIEFWNGSGWANLTTIYDNCTDANSAAGQEIKFAHSGVITWATQANWRKARLGDLSLGTPPYDRLVTESYTTDSY